MDGSYFARPQRVLALGEHFLIKGHFTAVRDKKAYDRIPPKIADDETFVLWSSWAKNAKSQGKLVTPEFSAPAFLSFFIAGYPSEGGNGIYIQDVVSGEILAVPKKAADRHWLKVVIRLPEKWRNRAIRVIAMDVSQNPRGWMGISTPFSTNTISWIQYLFLEKMLVFILLFFLLAAAIHFLASCFILGEFLYPNQGLSSSFFLMYGFLVYVLASYILFWWYFFSSGLGCALSFFFLMLPLALLFNNSFRQRTIQRLRDPDIRIPLFFMAAASVFYVLLLYGIREIPFDFNWLDHTFLRFGLAGDNLIPRLYAERLFEQADLRPPIMGDWLSSDRGPIQPAVLLTQWPLWNLIDNISPLPNVLDFYAQSLGTIFQCIWIPALWLLLRHLNVDQRHSAWIIAALIPSGFLFFHSIYTWPKLAAGAFITLAYCLFMGGAFLGRLPLLSIILASAASAVGFLAHGSAAFSLIGMAAVALHPRFFPGWQKTVAGMIIFIALLSPYMVYKRVHNPPGNRLLKYHLAGATGKTADQKTFIEALEDYYGQMTIPDFFQKKKDNIENILGTRIDWGGDPLTQGMDMWRRMQFWNLIPSLDFLNIGWLGLALIFLRRDKKCRRLTVLFLVVFASLSAWVLLIASQTGLHHGSYHVMLLLYAGLMVCLLKLPSWVYIPAIALHTAHGLLIWGLLTRKAILFSTKLNLAPIESYRWDTSFLVAATFSGAAIALIPMVSTKRQFE